MASSGAVLAPRVARQDSRVSQELTSLGIRGTREIPAYPAAPAPTCGRARALRVQSRTTNPSFIPISVASFLPVKNVLRAASGDQHGGGGSRRWGGSEAFGWFASGRCSRRAQRGRTAGVSQELTSQGVRGTREIPAYPAATAPTCGRRASTPGSESHDEPWFLPTSVAPFLPVKDVLRAASGDQHGGGGSRRWGGSEAAGWFASVRCSRRAQRGRTAGEYRNSRVWGSEGLVRFLLTRLPRRRPAVGARALPVQSRTTNLGSSRPPWLRSSL